MRSVFAMAALVAVAALLIGVSGASAKHRYTRRPVDSCVVHHRVLPAGTVCSNNCPPGTVGCSQQICSGGHWVATLPCIKPFCTPRCG
jgi:hypothetical protein